MSNERPILFSTPMVKALLAGYKTMTRRIVKLSQEAEMEDDFHIQTVNEGLGGGRSGHDFEIVSGNNWISDLECQYGQVGDILWVRETHYRYGRWARRFSAKKKREEWFFIPDKQFHETRYFDNPPNKIDKVRKSTPGWYKRPSIHMPKAACRIFLEITDVRVERLQDITEEDACKEGVESKMASKPDENAGHRLYKNYLSGNFQPIDARYSFMSLWYKINGEESWGQDPWVWVVSFKRTDRP